MNDRELLERAAKAAGHRITWGEKYIVGGDEVDCTDLPYILRDSPDESPCYWNPLDDDGDALRLAVRMAQLRGFFSFMRRWLICMAEESGDPADPCTATRRAIVRAAAEG